MNTLHELGRRLLPWRRSESPKKILAEFLDAKIKQANEFIVTNQMFRTFMPDEIGLFRIGYVAALVPDIPLPFSRDPKDPWMTAKQLMEQRKMGFIENRRLTDEPNIEERAALLLQAGAECATTPKKTNEDTKEYLDALKRKLTIVSHNLIPFDKK